MVEGSEDASLQKREEALHEARMDDALEPRECLA